MQLLLRSIRQTRKQTLRQWADWLGLDFRHLQRIETGQQPLDVRELEAVCQHLQQHPNDVVIWEGVPCPQQCPCCCHQRRPVAQGEA
jgi:DNA-binding Xre family transcriptional regulator